MTTTGPFHSLTDPTFIKLVRKSVALDPGDQFGNVCGHR